MACKNVFMINIFPFEFFLNDILIYNQLGKNVMVTSTKSLY